MALNLSTNVVEISGENHLQWHSTNLAKAIEKYPDLRTKEFIEVHRLLYYFKPTSFITAHVIKRIHEAIQEETLQADLDQLPEFSSIEEALNFAQGRDLLRSVFLHLKEAFSLGDLKLATKQLLIKSFKEATEASSATNQRRNMNTSTDFRNTVSRYTIVSKFFV